MTTHKSKAQALHIEDRDIFCQTRACRCVGLYIAYSFISQLINFNRFVQTKERTLHKNNLACSHQNIARQGLHYTMLLQLSVYLNNQVMQIQIYSMHCRSYQNKNNTPDQRNKISHGKRQECSGSDETFGSKLGQIFGANLALLGSKSDTHANDRNANQGCQI